MVIQEKPTIGNHHLQATKLDPRIANFISLICNTDMMNQQMKELGWWFSTNYIYKNLQRTNINWTMQPNQSCKWVQFFNENFNQETNETSIY